MGRGFHLDCCGHLKNHSRLIFGYNNPIGFVRACTAAVTRMLRGQVIAEPVQRDNATLVQVRVRTDEEQMWVEEGDKKD